MKILFKRNSGSGSVMPSSANAGEPIWYKDRLYIGSVGATAGGTTGASAGALIPIATSVEGVSELTLSKTLTKYLKVDGTEYQIKLPSSDPYDTARTPTAHDQAWSTITSTPTTLSGYGITDAATSTHGHGNITNGGKITGNGISVGSGDAIVLTDSSSDNILVKSVITFDGSTTNKYLSPKGTWENISAVTGVSELELSTTAATYLTVGSTSYKIKLPSTAVNHNQTIITKSGSTTYSFGADATVELVAGSNISLTADTTNNKITVANIYSYTHPSDGENTGSFGQSVNATPDLGTAFNVPYITVNSAGHVTAASTKTVTVKHPTRTESSTTSTKSLDLTSSTASNRQIDVVTYTYDTAGHETAKDTKTITIGQITASSLGLGDAMHFKGSLSSLPTPTTSDSYSNGDVILVTGTNKEYVRSGKTSSAAGTWEELGDQGSWALKTVSVTGSGELEGGGNLTQDRAITHKTSGATAGSYGPSANSAPGYAGTFSVPYVTVNSYGHVTGISTKTITMPSEQTLPTVYDKALKLQGQYSTGTTADTAAQIFSANSSTDATIKITGDSGIKTYRSSGTITVHHTNSVTAGTNIGGSSNVTPGYGDTFNVPYFSYDAQGHITGSGTHTVKIPDSDNTDTNYFGTVRVTTAGGTAAKIGTVSGHTYTLRTGNIFILYLENDNTVTSGVSLAVGGTTAKPVFVNGAAATNTWKKGTYLVYYDGTNYNTYLDRNPFRDTNTDTWRPVQVGGTQKLAGTTDTGAVNFIDGTAITASYASGVKFSHNTILTSGSTTTTYGSSTSSPGYSGTFNIPQITIDNLGHIKTISSQTITLPAADNTDEKVTPANVTNSTAYRVLLAPSTTYSTNGKPNSTEKITATGAGTINAVSFVKTSATTTNILLAGGGDTDTIDGGTF